MNDFQDLKAMNFRHVADITEEADRSKQGNLSLSHIIACSPINSVIAGHGFETT